MNVIRIVLLVCLCVLPLAGEAQSNRLTEICEGSEAVWLDPASGESIGYERLFARLAKSRVVLLGEEHTAVQHHLWQSYMLAALHSRRPAIAVGFEMLPRQAQSVLDDWSAGSLSEATFLDRSDWRKVWGYDAALYLPLLRFVRLHRLPGIALNVDRELVSLVGRDGWQALSVSQRGGLSDPAPASEDYRRSLANLYAYKQALRAGTAHAYQENVPDAEEFARIQRSDEFGNFVDAQLTWDRAMAEALSQAYHRNPDLLLVGIVGRGHLEYGYGIPHQLADLGIADVAVLLPVSGAAACSGLARDLATAVFVLGTDVEEPPAAAPPRLGVTIESAERGVRVLEVADASVAKKSGLRGGDLILTAAGYTTDSPSSLIEVITRQAPGTWLPLRIERNGELRNLVAKFPQSFDRRP